MAGEKVFATTGGKRTKKINGIAVYSQRQLVAPLLYHNSMNTDFFNHYLKNCLLPAIEPSSIIIMDNASFHKSSMTQELIKAHMCTFYSFFHLTLLS